MQHTDARLLRAQRSEAPELERLVGVDITPAQVLGPSPSLRVLRELSLESAVALAGC